MKQKKITYLETEAAGLDKINKIKFENINLGKENLSEAFAKAEKDDTKNKNNNIANISKIKEFSKKCKILNVELISSCFEPKGLILKIGPHGYENSLRKEKDGITYFGYEEEITENKEVFNYFIIYIII